MTDPLAVRFSGDAAETLRAVEGFLLGQPVHNNLVHGLLLERAASPRPGRYWWARRGDEVVGLAFQSPLAFRALVSPAEPEVVDALVDTMVAEAPDLPGVAGEAATAAAFAGRWAERRATPVVPAEGQRVYRLGSLRHPVGVAGCPRRAGPDDRERLVGWVAGFLAETEGNPSGPEELTDRHLARGLWLWEAGGEPVSMAVASPPVGGVSRIGLVYTPPPHRRRGYAAACVASLSQQVTGEGLDCILYTQLQNPTSNAVYRRIGYEPVVEGLIYRFG